MHPVLGTPALPIRRQLYYKLLLIVMTILVHRRQVLQEVSAFVSPTTRTATTRRTTRTTPLILGSALQAQPEGPQRLVLIGGGHAHVGADRLPDVRLQRQRSPVCDYAGKAEL